MENLTVKQIEEITSSVTGGESSALREYVKLKAIEKAVADALKAIQDHAINEAETYGQKSFQAFGANIELKNGASRWDYSGISAWKMAKDKLTYVEKIAQAGGGVDPDSGEVIEKANKIDGRSTIAIRLSK